MTFRIELHDVSFAYSGSAPVLRDITTTLKGSEITALVAPMGEGKSTFLKICAGLLSPYRGELIIDGKKYWNLNDQEQNAIRRRMGFDFQEGALIANMTVFQNLALPWRYHGVAGESGIRKKVEEWLERLGMERYRDVLPAALSTGLKRRISYIRAMMTDGAYLFWDEPTEGADEEQTRLMTDTIIGKKREGVGSLFSTQDGPFLRGMADRVIVFADGRIAYDGPLVKGRIPVEIETSGMLRG